MDRKTTVIPLLMTLLALSGCVSPQWDRYRNDIASTELKQRRFIIDKGYCEAVAHGSAPMPQMVYSNPGGGTTQFQVSGYSGGTYSNYYGTATTTPSAASSFASGVANGYSLGLAIRAKNDRKTIFRGCMYARGWTDEPKPAPHAETQSAIAGNTDKATPDDSQSNSQLGSSSWHENGYYKIR